MLRAKKFMDIKQRGLYKYLKNIENNDDDNISNEEFAESILLDVYYILLYHNDELDFEIIRNCSFTYNDLCLQYNIQRETYTNTWMLVCQDIIVLYIKNDNIQDFCSLYTNSKVYNFKIFKYNLGYLAFCLSHTIDDIVKLEPETLVHNMFNNKYLIISHFVKRNNHQDLDLFDKSSTSFVVLNYNVQNTIKYTNLYTFYSNIGFGERNITIVYFVDLIFDYIANFKNYPINYMCI